VPSLSLEKREALVLAEARGATLNSCRDAPGAGACGLQVSQDLRITSGLSVTREQCPRPANERAMSLNAAGKPLTIGKRSGPPAGRLRG
jgi:hypothetical protein